MSKNDKADAPRARGVTDLEGRTGDSAEAPEAAPPPAAAAAPVELVSPPAAAPVPIQKDLPLVSLTVYLTACGKRRDQTAGFKSWATACKLSPRTMLEWQAMWDDFLRRPTY